MELYFLPSTPREWEILLLLLLLLLLANAFNSGHDWGDCCLSALFFALFKTCWHARFSKIFAFLFSSKINLYLLAKLVLRGNPEFTKQWDKAASLILLSYSKSLHNKSRRSNTMKSFLTFRIINTSKFLDFQKVLTMKLSLKTHFTTNDICFFFFLFIK